jgi:asparagine N-glycosylation enzyme membrane subunit Stt3
VSMVSKKRKKKRRKKTNEVSVSLPLGGLEKIRGKLDKPLFLAAACGLVLTAAKPVVEGAVRGYIPILVFVLAACGAYSIYQTPKDKRDLWGLGIPALLLLAALFAHYSNSYGFPIAKDHTYFSIIAAVFCFFYSLSYHRVMKAEVALVLALFLSSLITHLVPAVTDFLAALDPYWHYKWMQGIYNDGYPPEFDELVYPMIGGLAHHGDPQYMRGRTEYGLDQRNTAMMTPVLYASLALAVKPFGVSLHDVAMLLPGIIASFTVVAMYLLVKEIFSDMQPYNKVAGLLAAFMLMLSPAFAMKAIATNCEDDALGMFLMVAGLFLFFASYHRRSFRYSVYCGLAFLLLRMGWGGSQYAYLTIGGFGTAYALVRFMHKKNAVEHLPYIVIPTVIYQFSSIILHERGGAPVFHYMPPNALYPLVLAIGLSVILELLRVRMYGSEHTEGDSFEYRATNWIENNITVIAVIVLLIGAWFVFIYKSPADFINFTKQGLLAAKKLSVVHQTVAEQNPLAGSFNDFLQAGYNRYGIALLYGLLMMPVLAYMVLKQGSVGALFLLMWGTPMLYGSYHKSAWIFASSASITAMGASIGLFSIAKKKDWESLRVIGAVMVVFIPIFYIPMFGPTEYNRFVGFQVMHMGPSSDRYYWEPALAWHRDHTQPGDAVLTWWDYGHWLTSYSHRPVLIDNLQADYYEIQDVARFFVNKTTEEEAFETVKAYNRKYEDRGWGLRYVTIDWTMIPKGSALHYIANGDIDTETPADPAWGWKNYAKCTFMADNSQLEEKVLVDADGSFYKARRIVFGCQGYVAGVIFDLAGDSIKEISVIDRYGQAIPWASWSQANDASLLGVQSLTGLYGTPVPSILYCAINWRELPDTHACRMPQFHTLVYVPQEFNDFMMTRLYLGEYLEEYRALGLYNREIKPLKHFRLVPDRNGDGLPDGEFYNPVNAGAQQSYGFVRTYEISYDGFSSTTSAI